MKKYSVVDLFAGAGGLSLGFMQTQKFDIKVAFENNICMQETYHKNHPGVELHGDVCKADYNEIKKKYGDIDVVIGGPPCQGFSNANRQKNHAINKNNMLVKQYIRAVLELQPKAFVMENVSMLKSDVHRFYLDKNDIQIIEKYKIPAKSTSLPLIDKQYVFPEAMNMIQDMEQIKNHIWTEEKYSTLNIIYNKSCKSEKKAIDSLQKHRKKLIKYYAEYVNNNYEKDYVFCKDKEAFDAIQDYFDNKITVSELKLKIEPAIMIQKMLGKSKEIIENEIVVDNYDINNGISAEIRSFAVFDYLNAILGSEINGYTITSKVLCAADYGAPQKRMRFVVAGVKKSISTQIELPNGNFDKENYRTVRDAIGDLEDVIPVKMLKDDKGILLTDRENLSELQKKLRNSSVLKNHIITQTREVALERFKALNQGENFHSLEDKLKNNTYTDVSRTQNTIYLRLNYDEPSGTVVNVRKSMWIHPTKDRALSIREAARLQTFPDDFVFCGTKDKQYQQVGNAVPPIMANAIAEELIKTLEKNTSR